MSQLAESMKMILMLIVFLSMTGQSIGQHLSMKQDSTNIYYQALRKVIGNECNQTIYVEYDYVLNSFFDKLPFSCQVKLVSQKNMIDMTRGKKSIVVHKLFPMKFEDGGFIIGIVPFGVKIRKKHLFYENSGVWHVQYLFNCLDKQLQFKEAKFFGI